MSSLCALLKKPGLPLLLMVCARVLLTRRAGACCKDGEP